MVRETLAVSRADGQKLLDSIAAMNGEVSEAGKLRAKLGATRAEQDEFR